MNRVNKNVLKKILNNNFKAVVCNRPDQVEELVRIFDASPCFWERLAYKYFEEKENPCVMAIQIRSTKDGYFSLHDVPYKEVFMALDLVCFNDLVIQKRIRGWN